MNLDDIKDANAAAKRNRFWILGAVILAAIITALALMPHSCSPEKVTLTKNLAATAKADAAVNRQIEKVAAGRARRDSTGRVLESTAKALKPRSDSATAIIRSIAARLPKSTGDSLRAAVAVKDSLLAVQAARIDTLERDTADYGKEKALCMDGKAANLLADSIATATGIQGIDKANAKAESAFKRGVIVGAVSVAVLAGILSWIGH